MGINDIVDQTTYNNIHLLNGAKPSTYTIGSGGLFYRYENVLYMPPVDDHGLFQFRTRKVIPRLNWITIRHLSRVRDKLLILL